MTTYHPTPYAPDLNFSPQDIASNREGLLTPAQEEQIAQVVAGRRRGAVRTARAFIIWFGLLLVVGYIFELINRVSNPDLPSMPPVFWILPVTLLFGMLVVNLIVTWWSGRHARRRTILQVEGVAQVMVSEFYYRGRKGMRYELKIRRRGGYKIFRFGSEEAVRRFPDGQTIRVYYIPFYPLDIVLSAEVA